MANDGIPAPNRPVVLTLLRKFCDREGLKLVGEPEFGYAGYLEGPGGRRSYFKGGSFDLNMLGAAEIARDKSYSAGFLKDAGFKVPESDLISSPAFQDAMAVKNRAVAKDLKSLDQALLFADKNGYPVFAKPNDDLEGKDVLKASNPDELMSAIAAIGDVHPRVLIQTAAVGKDYRILVLDDEVLAVIERRPFAVKGDGKSSLRDLIEASTAAFAKRGAGELIAAEDPRILTHLANQELTLGTVPAPEAIVQLLPNANLSSGGTARLATREISPEFADIAVRAGKTLGLRFFGLDLITPDIGGPGSDYAILELNAAPGLSRLYRQGEDEAAAVRQIYDKVFAKVAEPLTG